MLLIPDLPEFDVGNVIFVLSTLVGAVALAIGALGEDVEISVDALTCLALVVLGLIFSINIVNKPGKRL